MTISIDASILIVGGGPVGLTLALDLAWRGVKERIDDEGSVIDSCISTGVQQNLKEYLDRTAIFGPDDRSGSLALWFAVEMERLDRSG